jgi:hypothetical protein
MAFDLFGSRKRRHVALKVESPFDKDGAVSFSPDAACLPPRLLSLAEFTRHPELFLLPDPSTLQAATSFWNWMPEMPKLAPLAVSAFGGIFFEHS